MKESDAEFVSRFLAKRPDIARLPEEERLAWLEAELEDMLRRRDELYRLHQVIAPRDADLVVKVMTAAKVGDECTVRRFMDWLRAKPRRTRRQRELLEIFDLYYKDQEFFLCLDEEVIDQIEEEWDRLEEQRARGRAKAAGTAS